MIKERRQFDLAIVMPLHLLCTRGYIFKYTYFLCGLLNQSCHRGSNYFIRSAKRVYLHKIHTPAVLDVSYIFHKGCVEFKWNCPIRADVTANLKLYILHTRKFKGGNSVVAAILPSRMEVSYCTSGFFVAKPAKYFVKSGLPFPV